MPNGVDLFPGQGSTGHGKIERFFRTITQLLLQDLPGYVPPGSKKVTAKLTLPEFEFCA